MELRNRVLSCPMGHAFGNEDGTISDNEAAFYEERARGGVALLLVGTAQVAHPYGTYDTRFPGTNDDRFLPGLTMLASRVHRHGGRIAVQLNHMGANAQHDVVMGRPLLVPVIPKPSTPDHLMAQVSASEMAKLTMAFTQASSRVEYKVADDDDIAWVIERFADSTARVQRAGLDGVELHAGHGYLIDEFLSPTNTRADRWGGSEENRARLLVEIIRAIRARVGRDFPLWMRINALEVHKLGGEHLDEQLRIIERAVDAGIDALHLTAYHDTSVSTGPTDSYIPHVVGSLSDYAATVRPKISVPVITFGRFEPDEAEQVLRDGKADFVAFGRKLLADPDLVNKLSEGRVDDVKPCIYNYRCIGNIFFHERAGCVVNARTGREHDNPIDPTTSPRRVLVIGGGPAGIEAAVLLAQRGHAVSLWDSGTRLGGRLIDAAAADPLLDPYLGWLVRQVTLVDVDIRLGMTVTATDVSAAGYDEVIVATGADWSVPRIETGHSRIKSVSDVREWLGSTGPGPTMTTDETVGRHVVVLGGEKAGLSVALACARRARIVTVVEPGPTLGLSLGLPGRFQLLSDLEALGVTMLTNCEVDSVESSVVTVSADGSSRQVLADTVISTVTRPRVGLADELRAASLPVHTIGDCREVGFIEGATHDALAIGRAI